MRADRIKYELDWLGRVFPVLAAADGALIAFAAQVSTWSIAAVLAYGGIAVVSLLLLGLGDRVYLLLAESEGQ